MSAKCKEAHQIERTDLVPVEEGKHNGQTLESVYQGKRDCLHVETGLR